MGVCRLERAERYDGGEQHGYDYEFFHQLFPPLYAHLIRVARPAFGRHVYGAVLSDVHIQHVAQPFQSSAQRDLGSRISWYQATAMLSLSGLPSMTTGSGRYAGLGSVGSDSFSMTENLPFGSTMA